MKGEEDERRNQSKVNESVTRKRSLSKGEETGPRRVNEGRVKKSDKDKERRDGETIFSLDGYLYPRLTRGEPVKLGIHVGMFLCRQHRRWSGASRDKTQDDSFGISSIGKRDSLLGTYRFMRHNCV